MTIGEMLRLGILNKNTRVIGTLPMTLDGCVIGKEDDIVLYLPCPDGGTLALNQKQIRQSCWHRHDEFCETVESARDNNPHTKFKEHLENASKIVGKWPKWKQEILSGGKQGAD